MKIIRPTSALLTYTQDKHHKFTTKINEKCKESINTFFFEKRKILQKLSTI